MAATRSKGTRSEIQLRRFRLRLSTAALGKKAGMPPWRVFKVESDPQRARLGDVLKLDAALTELEAGLPAPVDYARARVAAIRRHGSAAR